MDFLDTVKEKSKSQGFILSIVTSVIILIADQYSTGRLRSGILYFSPQAASLVVYLITIICAEACEWNDDRLRRKNSMKSEGLVKNTMDMLNMARVNGVAEEEISDMEKIAGKSISAHLKMNLDQISQINEKEDQRTKQNKITNEIIDSEKQLLRESFSGKNKKQ